MYAKVIVDITNSEVDKVFDYKIPSFLPVSKGDMVLVPFGKRSIMGFVLDIADISSYDESKIKEIKEILLPQIIKSNILQLIHEMKTQYYLKYVDIIKLVIPSEIRNGKIKTQFERNIRIKDFEKFEDYLKTIRRNSKNPVLVYNHLTNKAEDNYTNLCKLYSSACINKLLELEILEETKTIKNRLTQGTTYIQKNITLNAYQTNAINAILDSKYNTFLLHGVTGSGKTEVYINVIKKLLSEHKNAIMLVPEISLTPQMVNIFTSIFGKNIAVLHSGLSAGEKFDEWNRIYKNEVNIVIGARSAIFAPVENLGVIIIDEEHDNSYISDSNPRYETYKVAQIRAKYDNCPLVLGSATPNIDSYHKAITGEFNILELPVRANNKEMPPIEIVDMLPEFKSGNTTAFSARLVEELTNTINKQNQALIFINRRGFSSYISCRSCGYIPRCTECDITLSYHKECNELKCHYCGKRFRNITKCPECGSNEIKLCGIGTQRVVEDLQNLFTGVPIFRMDMDTTKTKNSHAKILSDFANTKPSILVGTQMIAKGHDFPQVDLVGILDADLSLFFGEYRASEKTFQLITQVAGRAGRSEIAGKVVLQTYFPKNYVYNLVANYNYKKFFDKEINLRKTTNFPPFAEIVRVLISNEQDYLAKQCAFELFTEFKKLKMEYRDEIYFLQAMQSPLSKLKNKYRYQIVVRYNITKSEEILSKIYSTIDQVDNGTNSIFVELNPSSLS